MSDTQYLDQLETRDPEQRELAQFNLLSDVIRKAVAAAPGWAEQLKGIDPPGAVRKPGVEDPEDVAVHHDGKREIKAAEGLGRIGLELEVETEQRFQPPPAGQHR